jgi:hypothetical protein
MRLIVPLAAMIAAVVLAAPVPGAELTTAAELGRPVIVLEPSEVLQVQRACEITLPAGETTLTMPLGALGVDPAGATLEVAEPAGGVRVAAMEVAPDTPQTARWRLIADQAGPVVLRLTYPVKGIKWGIGYSLTLAAGGGLAMQGRLTLTNGLARALTEALIVMPNGQDQVVSLEAGESADFKILELTAAAEAVERSFVYDKDRLGDAAVEMLTVDREGLRPAGEHAGGPAGDAPPAFTDRPLLAGKARLFAPPEAGGDFIGETSIPYVPPGEPVEIKVGPASGIAVTRTRTEAKEVNARQDAHRKTVLFDLDETYELKLRNLRRTPVELIVREHPQDTWQVLAASTVHVKTDAHTLEFRVHLEAGEEAELSYKVRRLNLQP